MARPGEVTQNAPEGMPYGSGAALQRLESAVPIDQPGPTPLKPGPSVTGMPQVQPAPVMSMPPQIPSADMLTGSQANNGLDTALFAQSDQPGVPMAAGSPFGSGPSFRPLPTETPAEFMGRVADSLSQSPAATDALGAYVQRIRRGV